MGVDRRPTLAQAYAIARLALWAGDLDIVRRLIYRPAFVREGGGGEREIQRAVKAIDKQLSLTLMDWHLSQTQDAAEKHITPIETAHFRGIVSNENPVVFELRAYLVNLKVKVTKAFVQHMQKCMGRQPEASYTGVHSWMQGENPAIHVSFTGLGQVRALGYWCKQPTFPEIEERFRRLLEDDLEFEV
jgi:hypothetical protein